MRSRLVAHEVRVLARGRTAATVLSVLVIVVAYAAANGSRWTREQRATLALVQADDRLADAAIADQLDELARRGDPRPDLLLAGMAWYIFQPEGAVAPAPHIDPRRAEAAASEWVGARHAVLPHAPLAALAVGQSDLHPYYSRVTIRTRPVLVNSDEIANPVNLLNGRFDLAFVLTFCWPVLVLPLIYNVLSEDRDNGTLALVASQPVSLRTVVMIRLLVRVGVAVALTVVTSVVVLFASRAVVGADAVIGPVLWTAAVAATGVLWAGVAAAVNGLGWRSATNATIMTALWLAAAIIAPAVIGEVAGVLEPVPSRVQLINAIRTAGNMRPGELAALMTAYYEAHPDAAGSHLSADVTAIRGLAQQDEIDRRIEPIVTAHRQALARQQGVVDRLRFVSPPLLIDEAVTELAGTTTARYRRFADQLDSYHRVWRAYFYPLVHGRVSLTKAHYQSAPRFGFQEEPPVSVRRRAALLIGTAALIGLLLLGAGLRRVTRSPVA
jgi:ABC-2 type transport system permease protein